MNTLSEIILALFGRWPAFANVATGTHEGGVTKNLEQSVSTRYLLGTVGTSSSEVDLCDASDLPLGVITDEGETGEPVNVALLGASPSTLLMVASEAITAGSPVYTATGGKVQNEPASAGTTYQVGYALTAATGDSEPLEVCPIPPRKTVVIAAFTGTAATDIAALGTALEAAPDKVVVLS